MTIERINVDMDQVRKLKNDSTRKPAHKWVRKYGNDIWNHKAVFEGKAKTYEGQLVSFGVAFNVTEEEFAELQNEYKSKHPDVPLYWEWKKGLGSRPIHYEIVNELSGEDYEEYLDTDLLMIGSGLFEKLVEMKALFERDPETFGRYPITPEEHIADWDGEFDWGSN